MIVERIANNQINGLEKKNYRNTLTTDNLFEIRNNLLINKQ
jgi:hypothetical protein